MEQTAHRWLGVEWRIPVWAVVALGAGAVAECAAIVWVFVRVVV